MSVSSLVEPRVTLSAASWAPVALSLTMDSRKSKAAGAPADGALLSDDAEGTVALVADDAAAAGGAVTDGAAGAFDAEPISVVV